MKQRISSFTAGLIAGAVLFCCGSAVAAGIAAQRSVQQVYVDGAAVQLDAYAIDGYNYVKLRDIGEAVDFNVYWDGQAIRIDTGAPYTGTGPVQPAESGYVSLPTDGSRYIPRVGDVIRCDDGTPYIITDVARYGNSPFTGGALPPLPEPTCDWGQFPEVPLPDVEVRHFVNSTGDIIFVRNLYETRRMQYTLYNLMGAQGKVCPVYLTTGTEETGEFWPWRESELSKHVGSFPASSYSVEAWDVYKDGSFQNTRYCILVK